MEAAPQALRKLYRGARELVHPLVDGFLPVTYTPDECNRRKRRLDPTGARNQREPNPATDRRIASLISVLGVDRQRAERWIDEARSIVLPDSRASDGVPLASPMCYEDRYTLYVVTRAVAPQRVVETGVAHGVSSAYILSALEAAESGKLTSVEISPDPGVGRMVGQGLRRRWTLHTGDSLKLLPGLLAREGPIDLFLHDSVHDYRHMRSELELAWPHLRPGGVLCAHDVLQNNAFERFLRRHGDRIGTWGRSVNFGLIRKRP